MNETDASGKAVAAYQELSRHPGTRMPIQQANWSQSSYQKLVEEALKRIPAYSPEWTDYNQSDPGVTLVQLFAWLGESLLYRSNRIPEASRTLFRKVAARVRRRRRVKRLLISGGNRKTRLATAGFIANTLGLPLHRIDLSSVVNKYIGETEKNLRRLIDSAESSSVILFVDEADALFDKQSEAKDSHDRNAQQNMSGLLRRLGRHRGLVILATNDEETSGAHRWCQLRCDISKLAPSRKRSAMTGAVSLK